MRPDTQMSANLIRFNPPDPCHQRAIPLIWEVTYLPTDKRLSDKAEAFLTLLF